MINAPAPYQPGQVGRFVVADSGGTHHRHQQASTTFTKGGSRCGKTAGGTRMEDEMDIVKALRGELNNCECCAYGSHECACDAIWPEQVAEEAADEIERLRQACRNAYEVWAGSEGIPEPETAAEAYVLQLLIAMKDEVKKGL